MSSLFSLQRKAMGCGLIILFLLILVALFAPWISTFTGIDPNGQNISARYLPPLSQTTNFHLLGTDENGRDIFLRLIYGARVSLGVALLVAFTTALIGCIVGSVAGYYGGYIDTLLMRLTDSLLSLPLIPILIVVSALDIGKIPWLHDWIAGPSESIFKMIIILMLFSWMPIARLVRGSTLSLKEREFVQAAQAIGARDRAIIFRHILPNITRPILTAVTLGIGESILFEAALSFLGLGIMPPTPSWGNMLNNAQEIIHYNIWLAILPGFLILITVVSFNLVGDGLQSITDPREIN